MRLSLVGSFVASVALFRMASGWMFGTYVLFLIAHGLTLFQANLVNMVFMASNFLLESPTGYLADKYGQKRAHLTGLVFWGAGMFIYGSSTRWYGFVLAEFTAAIGSSFVSGALDSWLTNQTDETTMQGAKAYAGSIGAIASIPSALLGSLVASIYGLKWPWFLSGINCMLAFVITAVILAGLPDTHDGKEKPAPSIKEAYTLILKSSQLRYVALIGFSFFLAVQPFNMFWSVIFKERSGETWWLGLMWIGISLTTSLGAWLSRPKKKDSVVARSTISLLLTAVALPMALTPFVPGVFLLVGFFLIHEIGRGAYETIVFTYSNRHIPDHIRSTSNSIRSQVQALGSGAGLLASGLLTVWFHPLVVWGIAAALLIVLAAYSFANEE